MANPADRRRHPRLPIRIPVDITYTHAATGEQKTIEAEILDISLGGAFVHCTALVEIGAEVLLKIRYEESPTLQGRVIEQLTAEQVFVPQTVSEKSVVKWVRGSHFAGLGVEFLNITDGKKQFVQKLEKHIHSLKTPAKQKTSA